MKTTWIGGPTHEKRTQHLPGYQGHVAFLESDGQFGKSFAKITNNCMTKQQGLKDANKGVMACQPEGFKAQEITSFYQQEYQKPQQIKQEFVNHEEYHEQELENLLKTKRVLQDQLKAECDNKSCQKTIDNVAPLDRIPILGYQGYRSVNRAPIREVKQQDTKNQQELFMTLDQGFQKDLLRKDGQLRKKIEEKSVPIVGYTGHIHQLVSENQYGQSYHDQVKQCQHNERNKEIINYHRAQQQH